MQVSDVAVWSVSPEEQVDWEAFIMPEINGLNKAFGGVILFSPESSMIAPCHRELSRIEARCRKQESYDSTILRSP